MKFLQLCPFLNGFGNFNHSFPVFKKQRFFPHKIHTHLHPILKLPIFYVSDVDPFLLCHKNSKAARLISKIVYRPGKESLLTFDCDGIICSLAKITFANFIKFSWRSWIRFLMNECHVPGNSDVVSPGCDI